MNVLIVEEELLTAADLVGIVEDIGYKVIAIASSLEQALAHAPRATVALVDLKLADGASGTQLARRLIDRYGIQVILVTGNPTAIVEGFDGALDLVSKPFTSERLVKALRKAQGLHRQPTPDRRLLGLGSYPHKTMMGISDCSTSISRFLNERVCRIKPTPSR